MDYAITIGRTGHRQGILIKKQGVRLRDKLEASAAGHRSPSHMNTFQSGPWGSHPLLGTYVFGEPMTNILLSASLCSAPFSRSPVRRTQCKTQGPPPNSTSDRPIPLTVSYLPFFFFPSHLTPPNLSTNISVICSANMVWWLKNTNSVTSPLGQTGSPSG